MSNIRTWLNSNEKEGIYNDQKPQVGAMAEYKTVMTMNRFFFAWFYGKEIDCDCRNRGHYDCDCVS